jgi:hypothetical protein
MARSRESDIARTEKASFQAAQPPVSVGLHSISAGLEAPCYGDYAHSPIPLLVSVEPSLPNKTTPMIIWGSKAKESEIAAGTFFCPNCMADSAYSHMRVSRYFTLYFIPLFSTSTLGEYVRCRSCNVELSDVVLRRTREEILLATQPWICLKCNNTNPSPQASCLACGAPKSLQPPPLPSRQPVLAAPPPASAKPESGRCPVCGMLRAHSAGCTNTAR